MKARGGLEVVPDDDGRSQPFRLTALGCKRLEKAVPAWSKAQQQVKKVLGDGFVNQLNQALKHAQVGAGVTGVMVEAVSESGDRRGGCVFLWWGVFYTTKTLGRLPSGDRLWLRR